MMGTQNAISQNATDSYCFDESEKDAMLQEPLLLHACIVVARCCRETTLAASQLAVTAASAK
jgi:hypothetical protein